MDEVKRKVFLDLFANPGTLIPIAGGLTAMMAAWAGMGDTSTLMFGGIAGVLTGVGIFASRFVLGLEDITQRAYDYHVTRRQNEQEKSLELLDEKLVTDRDPRTQTSLRQLRSMYQGLKKKVKDGEVNASSYEVLEKVDRLFASCVDQLQHSYEIWKTARSLSGTAQETLMNQRDEIVKEVEEAVEHLGSTIDRVHLVASKKNRSELSRLREELDESLRVAKEVDAQIESLENSPQYDASEFE